jgi:hypothetical protein
MRGIDAVCVTAVRSRRLRLSIRKFTEAQLDHEK